MAERANQGRQEPAAEAGDAAKATAAERAAEAQTSASEAPARAERPGREGEAAAPAPKGNGQSVAAGRGTTSRAASSRATVSRRRAAAARAANGDDSGDGDDDEAYGGLRVRTFAYPAADDEGPFERGFAPLPGIVVHIDEVRAKAFGDTVSTDDRGEAYWPSLPAGVYLVTVRHPSSKFSAPEAYWLSGAGENESEVEPDATIDVPGPGETVVEIGFAPEAAVIGGVIYQDVELGEQPKPNGQPRLGGVLVEALAEGERIGYDVSDDDGAFSIEIGRPGLIELRVPLTLQRGGASLHFGSRSPLLVPVAPGGRPEVPLHYQARRSEIIVDAHFEGMEGGELVQAPLSGVTFSLYRGPTAGGVPFRRETARGPAPVMLGDLDEGHYTLCAEPPAHFRGRALEPAAPNGDCRPLWVAAGTTVPLLGVFAFRPVAGRVMGYVVDDQREVGVAGVPVFLTPGDGQGESLTATTGAGGEYAFDGVELGDYVVSLPEKVMLAGDTHWEPAPGSGAARPVAVRATGATLVTPPFALVPEVHRLFGHVRTATGRAAPFAVIDFFDESGRAVGSTTADGEGFYDWLAPRAGTFGVQARLVPAGRLLQVQMATLNSEMRMDIIGPPEWPDGWPWGGSTGGSGGGSVGGSSTDGAVAAEIANLGAYPLLTEGMGYVGSSTASGGGGGASAVQRVENAIRDVLGWRPKEGDSKGYLAALTQAFTPVEHEGGTTWKWTPRSYHVQADMGKITGAQASIYARAQAALDQSLPLLDGLEALDPSSDDENLEAVRAVVRSDFSELVHELGEEGGPRVARVDVLFDALIGEEPATGTEIDSAEVEGELGDLQERFGLDRDRVNTVDEEQNLTNFLIIVDHVRALRMSWLANRAFFVAAPGTEPFFGTQLVLVSRALAVAAESVQEVFYVMDSVFLRAAERQTTQLIYPNGTPPIYLESLLTWAERAAADELPTLIQEGGKIGARAAVPTLQKLAMLVQGALLPAQQSPTLPAGYKTARVQRALSELAAHLQAAADLAGQLSEPNGGPGPLPPPPSGEAARGPGSVPFASIGALVDAVRGLPPELFGSSQGGNGATNGSAARRRSGRWPN